MDKTWIAIYPKKKTFERQSKKERKKKTLRQIYRSFRISALAINL